MSRSKLSARSKVAIRAIVSAACPEYATTSADTVEGANDPALSAALSAFGKFSTIDQHGLFDKQISPDRLLEIGSKDHDRAVAAIRKVLLEGTGVKDQAIVDRLLDEVDAPSVAELAELIANTRAVNAVPIDLALEGKIASAVKAIPLQSYCVTYDMIAPEDFLDLIESVARYHLVRSLISANELARRRCYQPTGLAALDLPHMCRAPRAKTVAAVLAYNAYWIGGIINVTQNGKNGTFSDETRRQIEQTPDLIAHAGRASRTLIETFGKKTPVIINELNRYARRQLPGINHYFGSLATGLHPNKSVYGFQNAQPLPRLFLASVVAHGWLEVNDGKKSPLRRAMDDIRQGRHFQSPGIGKKALPGALRLFYVVRNFRSCDETTRGAASREERLDVITRIYEEKVELNEYEAFNCGEFSTAAYRAHRAAITNGDQTFLNEIQGWMPTLLGL